jgi:uncharacterized C2H2 Zn-finger protein
MVKDNIFVFVFRKSFSKHINKVICKIIGGFCNLSYAFGLWAVLFLSNIYKKKFKKLKKKNFFLSNL